MICKECGTENKDGLLFCSRCGKALVDEPIALDLEQLKVPAASRKAHIVKVNATKKAETGARDETTPPVIEAVQEAPSQNSEPDPTPEDGELILLTTPGDNSNAQEGSAASAQNTQEQSTAAVPENEQPMKIKNWIPVFILSVIPCVNIIMLFIWAFSSATNKSKKTYAQTALIFTAIALVLAVIAAVLCFTLFGVNLQSLSGGFKF